MVQREYHRKNLSKSTHLIHAGPLKQLHVRAAVTKLLNSITRSFTIAGGGQLLSPPPIQGDQAHHIIQHHLRFLWTNLFLVPAVDVQTAAITQHCTTWLELFLLYSIKGAALSNSKFQEPRAAISSPHLTSSSEISSGSPSSFSNSVPPMINLSSPLSSPEPGPSSVIGLQLTWFMISAKLAVQGEYCHRPA